MHLTDSNNGTDIGGGMFTYRSFNNNATGCFLSFNKFFMKLNVLASPCCSLKSNSNLCNCSTHSDFCNI